MLSATASAMRFSARRINPRVASALLAPKPTVSFNQSINFAQARLLSSTGRLSYANASNDTPSRIGLIGARGYTGQGLVDLLNERPMMDLQYVSSRELKGQELKGYTKRKITYDSLSPEDVAQLDKDGKVDCWVMALPNGVCQPFVDALGQSSSLIIDLSADYRFEENGPWTYGLCELKPRSTLAQSRRISNPGCYATGAQLALAPMLEHIEGSPQVFGVSGYSGAGTKPSPKNDVNNLKDNLLPCKSLAKEISHHLGTPTAFMPHVASWFRGIHLTISIPLNKEMTSREIIEIYQERYAGEKLVKVVGEAPTGKRLVVCATIDNLNLGAATQCLQNMNLALGYDEYQGIPI
ncbi:N-acetyl-gamma-glutamyl-phosphate reductase [Trichoderma barbatum]